MTLSSFMKRAPSHLINVWPKNCFNYCALIWIITVGCLPWQMNASTAFTSTNKMRREASGQKIFNGNNASEWWGMVNWWWPDIWLVGWFTWRRHWISGDKCCDSFSCKIFRIFMFECTCVCVSRPSIRSVYNVLRYVLYLMCGWHFKYPNIFNFC